VEDLLQASWIVDQLNAGGALAAERALADRMGGVALDVDHRAALSGHDLAAPDSAEWADRRRGGRAGRLQRRGERATTGPRCRAGRPPAPPHPARELPEGVARPPEL